MGDKPLTWQQVLIVLLILGLIVFAPMAIHPFSGGPARVVGSIGATVCLALIAWLTWSQIQLSRRADIYPDMLVSWAPPKAVLSLGDAHVFISSVIKEGWAAVVVVFQNTRNGSGSCELRFSPTGRAPIIDSLCMELPPAGVVAAILPLWVGSLGGQIVKWDLVGWAKSNGEKIRFKRYAAMTRKVNPGLQALGLLGGAIVWGGGTSWKMIVHSELLPPNPATPSPGWRAHVIWGLDNRTSPERIPEMLDKLIAERLQST